MRYELSDLRLFLEIAQARSLTAGAAAVFITPSAASYRLKNLEQALGTALFERTPRGMDPTPAGEAMLAPVVVTEQADRSGTTEGTGSYTTRTSAAATGLALSLKDTPQSITVVTQQRMEDQRMQSLNDVLLNTTGISASIQDGNRVSYYSRDFHYQLPVRRYSHCRHIELVRGRDRTGCRPI